jgi:16S rRNA (uracil1498-N3)-methyltransferase
VALPTFLVPSASLHEPFATISGEEAKHLRVRRVRVGELVRLIDGTGGVRYGAVERILPRSVVVRCLDTPPESSESPLETYLAIPLIRAERLERALEKATELGVHHLLVFSSARSRPYDARARLNRWQRILLEATKQCQRLRVPTLSLFHSFEELISRVRASLGLFFDFGPEARALSAISVDSPPKSVLLTVGPEGGLTAEESALLHERGFHAVTLGPRILRAETAALAALTLVQFRWGDLGVSASTALPSLRGDRNTRTFEA